MSALRSNAAFLEHCVNPSQNHCNAMEPVLHSYADFHKRMFAPETRCEDRRILLVRESFKDVVGVGHMRMGLHRFMAAALSFGRAVVFSTCAAPDDPWRLKHRQLWKAAHPYNCGVPHLSPASFYEGYGGIDLRWTPARRRIMSQCNISEVTLDLNSKDLAKVDKKRWCGTYWKGCRQGWNQDQMECDVRAKAGCPDLISLFGWGARSSELAKAPLVALYNARRDSGFIQAYNTAHSGERWDSMVWCGGGVELGIG